MVDLDIDLTTSTNIDITLAETLEQGATTFIGLTDSPSSYSGQAGRFVKVNTGETGLEFAASSATVDDIDDITNVTITSVGDNEVLAYDTASSLWINQTPSEAGLVPTSTNVTAGSGLTGGGSLSSSIDLGVGQGTGITVSSDAVAIDLTAELTHSAGVQYNYVDLATGGSAPSYKEGRIYWDTNDGTLNLMTDVEDVTQQVGQEIFLKVVNKTGVTLTNGQVVYINGAQGNRPTVDLADASTMITSDSTIGVVTADIEDNQEGYITTYGLVRGLDTSAFTEGDVIYLSTTAGEFTATEPSFPNHKVKVGYVTTAHITQGVILVSVRLDEHLEDLTDTNITSVGDNELLSYDTASTAWINKTLAEAGVSAVGHTHTAGDITDFDTEVSNNTDVAANTSARHNAVTIGTANGLSLSTQQLSLTTATTASSGAMSNTDKSKLDGIEAGAEVNDVTSVFGRTGSVTAASNDYTWAQINKSTSDIADITTRSHTSLTDIGTNTHANIDTHIADTTIHFSDLSGFDTDDLSQGSSNLYDQTVSITGGTNVQVTGSYPSFGISDGTAALSYVKEDKMFSFMIESPTATESIALGALDQFDSTIQEIRAYTTPSGSTVTFQLQERGETTPNTVGTDIMTSTLVADYDQQSTTSFTNAGITGKNKLHLSTSAVSGSPAHLVVEVLYDRD